MVIPADPGIDSVALFMVDTCSVPAEVIEVVAAATRLPATTQPTWTWDTSIRFANLVSGVYGLYVQAYCAGQEIGSPSGLRLVEVNQTKPDVVTVRSVE